MASNAPTFREPEYGDEGGRQISNAEASVNKVVSDDSKPTQPPSDATQINVGEGSQSMRQISQQITASDKRHPSKPEASHDSEEHHLKFTETAKNAAGHVSRKLHLHRGEGRGPSEARQRRQSTVLLQEQEQEHLPFYVHLRNALYGSLTMFTTFPYWVSSILAGCIEVGFAAGQDHRARKHHTNGSLRTWLSGLAQAIPTDPSCS